jgi:hypothetical protein
MSPNIWLTVGMAVALIGFPVLSLAVAFVMRLKSGSTDGRPRKVDTTAPGRTIPGGDDRRPYRRS